MRSESTALLKRLFTEPAAVGPFTFPPPAVIALAAIGAVLLLVVAVYRWPVPADEHSYWIGARRLIEGAPLYDPAATAVTPYAYRYPPVVAQVLVPVAAVLSSMAFTIVYTGAMLICLWWLGGRNLWVALALVAFPPVAIELWFRNVHLFLAVLLVLAVRGRSPLFTVGAGIKIGPGLGLLYLASKRSWRPLATAAVVGIVMLATSFAVSPAAWQQFAEITLARGALDQSGFVAIPYAVRLLAGILLAVVAGRIRSRFGEPLLVVAVTLALPTLWFTALSTLVAIVPIVRHHRSENQ